MTKSCLKWLFSPVYSDACPLYCWIICIKRNTQLYNVHLDMRLSFRWHAVFEIKSVLVIVDYENIPLQPFWWVFFFYTFSTVGDRWKPLSFKMSILNMLSCWFGRQTPDHSRVCRCCFHTNYQLKAGVHNDNTFYYQYRNWLFGFTLALSLLLTVIIIKLILCRKYQQW